MQSLQPPTSRAPQPLQPAPCSNCIRANKPVRLLLSSYFNTDNQHMQCSGDRPCERCVRRRFFCSPTVPAASETNPGDDSPAIQTRVLSTVSYIFVLLYPVNDLRTTFSNNITMRATVYSLQTIRPSSPRAVGLLLPETCELRPPSPCGSIPSANQPLAHQDLSIYQTHKRRGIVK